MEIRPLETHYGGYRFRSRTEARWAVCFDTLGILWEYEREGFVASDGTCYLPDFWLPEQGIWIEVKGVAPTAPEKHKALMLSIGDKHDVLMVVGVPGREDLFVWPTSRNTTPHNSVAGYLDVSQAEFDNAAQSATSARFDGSDPTTTRKVPPDILAAVAEVIDKTMPEISPAFIENIEQMIARHGVGTVRSVFAEALNDKRRRLAG